MKKYLLLLMLLVTGLVLTGCMSNTRTNQDFKVLSINDIKNLQTEIKFKVRSGVIDKALATIIDDFHKEYPFITVKLQTISGDYDLIRSSTILDINSKKNRENVPDLLIGYPDHFVEYYGGSNLVNLSTFIEDKEVGLTETDMNDIIPGYLPENQGFDAQNPDDLYGLPFNKSTEVMVYNKTAFKVLFGENYLDKVPSTWDEVKTVGEEIITKVKAGELDNTFVDTYNPETKVTTYLKVSDYLADPNNIKFIPFGYDSADNAFITLTRQFGGRYTGRDSIFKGYIYFDNPESRAAMTYFLDMRNDGLFSASAMFGDKFHSKALQAIQVLMSIGSSAGIGYNVNDKYEYELGVAPIPYYSEDAKYVIQQGTNIGMLNHNTDEEKLASWLFIKYLLRPENTAEFAMATGGYLPVRAKAYDTEAYKEYLTNPTDDKKEYSAAAKVALYDYIEKEYKFFVDDAFIGSAKIREQAGSIFNKIVANKEDLAQTYKDAYNSLAPYVPKNN